MEILFDFLQIATILAFIFSSTKSSAIHREFEFLILEENSQYYGISPSKDEYTIIHIDKSFSSRTRREAAFKDRPTEVSFKAFGEDYRLHVTENSVLIPGGLRAEYVNRNGDVIKERDISRGCYYVGSVVSHKPKGNALSAISLCNGISGLISTRKHNLYIKPLRKDHGREYMNKLGHNDSQYHPHLVYRRNAADQHSDPSSADYFCGLDSIHFHLTNTSIISPPNTTPPPTSSGDESTRKRRQTSAKYLEVMVTIDRDMANLHGDTVQEYATSLLNVAAARFQDESLGTTPLFFSIVRFIILDSDTVNEQGTSLQVNSNGEDTLTSFCNYQSALNPTSDGDPGHWDLAILLTRKDLALKSSSSLLAIATAYGTCQPPRQCLISEDYGLSAGLVVAHEIGHSLGMTHDGDLQAQSCPNGQHLMSSTRINGLGTFQWSQCSQSKYQSFISQFTCLDDIPAEQLLEVSEDLGFESNSNEQCRLYSASSPLACTEAQLNQIGKTLAATCGILHCVENGVCKPTPLPSLDGTVCGVGMVCKEGSCQSGTTSTVTANEPIRPLTPINGGWSEWLSYLTPCTRTCGGGIQLQYRACTNPAPANGGATCVGSNNRPRLCNDQPCLTSQLDFKDEQCETEFGIGSLALTTQGFGDALCQMNCFDPILGTFSSNGLYVDGTHCGDDFNVCVNGRCERFGCDGIQDSGLVKDQCGVCGGDGTSCFKEGYYNGGYIGGVVNALTFARNTREIYVENTNPIASIGIKVGDNYIINGQNQPNGTVRNFDFFDNSVLYEKNCGVETISIPGPTREEFTLTVYVSDGVFANLAVYTPAVFYRYFGEPVTLLNNYKWLVEEGTCYSCGSYRQNVVTCVWLEENVNVSGTFCNNEPRPPEYSLCPCTYTWFYQSYQPCNATCGTDSYRTRTAVCVSETNPQNLVDSSLCPQPPFLHERCNVPACPTYEWLLQGWGQCSVTCGTGVQSRTVICHESTSSSQVSDSFCNHQRPVTVRICFMPTCPCEAIPCGPGTLFNPVSCLCQECQELNCGNGFSYNPSTCQCEECEPIYCGSGSFFNTVTCSCQECPELNCANGFSYNPSTCQCEECEPIYCGSGSFFNTVTCLCQACVQTACPSGRRYNAETCQCEECQQLNCANGFSYNPSTCRCEVCQPLLCPNGYRFNADACLCEVCQPLLCPNGYRFNADACLCEVCYATACPAGQSYNAGSCRCEACPILICEAGQRFNTALCFCEVCPITACPSGHSFNVNSCSCEAVCVEQPCSFGSNFNFDTCQCESDLPCGALVEVNPSTAKEGSLVQFQPVKGQLCSVALKSPLGFVIKLTLVVVFVDGQENEKFEVKDGLKEYIWSSPLYNLTLQSESNLLLINLLVREDGHGYFIKYELLENTET